MLARSPRCPLCGEHFEVKYVDFQLPFRCPSCKGYLRVPHSYSRLWSCAALLISAVLCFALGARDVVLLVATLLTWIPVLFVLVFWTRHFAPPTLKAGSHGQGFSDRGLLRW
jgi:hypothetical protein